ncbi:Uncharacterised protein [Vibrio cholerae]|nr:Uncharacterised protein [Vibrio cholerae]
MVSALVWGTMVSLNAFLRRSLTVKLMPSTVIEPFSATYLLISAGILTHRSTARPTGIRSTISPTPSTCPETI